MGDAGRPQAPMYVTCMMHASISSSAPPWSSDAAELSLEHGVLALYRAARCAEVLSRGDTVDPGLSRILISVARQGRVRPSAIAQDNHIDVSTASRHVDALVKQGFVAKAPDPDDARACLVELTASGREVIEAMLRNRTAAVEPALDAWSAGDRQQLVALLVRLAQDLDQRVAATREVPA